MVLSSFACSTATDIAAQSNVGFYMMAARRKRVLMVETAIQFLERWRQAHVYAELRALEQLDATVAECVGAAAEDGISADDLENAAGGSLKEYLRTAIINTSE
jgi:xanthine dehydrogenase iron-sulfur cluster and FAD-binding subunit A